MKQLLVEMSAASLDFQSEGELKRFAKNRDETGVMVQETKSAIQMIYDQTLRTNESVAEIKKATDIIADIAFKEVSDGITKSIDSIRAIAERTGKLDEARVNVVDVVQNLTAIANELDGSVSQFRINE